MEGAMDLRRRGQAGGDHGRMRNGHQHRAPDPIRESGQNAVRRHRAPVLADQVTGLSFAEGFDQADDVQRQGRPVVEGTGHDLAGWIAPQEGGYGAVTSRSQPRHLMLPGPGVVRIAVQQQDQRALARFQIGELQSIRADAALQHVVDPPRVLSVVGEGDGKCAVAGRPPAAP